MKTPLYQDHQVPKKPGTDYHAGLWFERFFNRYEDNWEVIKEVPERGKKEGKKDWIETVIGEQGDIDKLAEFQNRQYSLITALKGQSQRYTTDWNFVSGMGIPHPVENGFSWHPTLAVPYVSGSAVKGLVRAWVEMNDDELSKEEKKARLKSWFGTADKNEVAEQAGNFIFFDAIPDKQPTLVCDIMTPHMGKWYENENGSTKAEDLPADWHEPNPIPFLAVKKACFIFSIAPRLEDKDNQLEKVFQALENALLWLGAGAKTATGYGYMSSDASFEDEKLERLAAEQKKIEKQRKDDQVAKENKDRSPLAQKYFITANIEEWEKNIDVVWQKGILEDWVDQLEQQEEIEKEIAQHLAQLLEQYFSGIFAELEKPDNKQLSGKKKEKKKKPKFKDNQINLAKRLRALQAKIK